MINGKRITVVLPAYNAEKKNDRVDAQKISDLLRCNYFPECYLASREIRDRRRVLRYRNLLVRQSIQMKNRIASMLMETGISYNKQKLHRRRYFNQLLEDQADAMPSSMPELLRLSRLNIDGLERMNKQLLDALKTDHVLAARVERLMTVPSVGQVLSLTWALEMGDIARFASVKDAVSYCGLCAAERSSGGKVQRSPISKQRNKYLETWMAARQTHINCRRARNPSSLDPASSCRDWQTSSESY